MKTCVQLSNLNNKVMMSRLPDFIRAKLKKKERKPISFFLNGMSLDKTQDSTSEVLFISNRHSSVQLFLISLTENYFKGKEI